MNVETQTYSAFITARNKRIAEEYSVLLDSLNISNNVIYRLGSWVVEVNVSDHSRAIDEIYSYERSGRIDKVKNRFGHIRFQKVNVFYFISALAAMAVFHFIVYDNPGADLIKLGRSSASAITDGQIWRAVTGLTLHADIKHLFSNIIFGGIAVFSLATLVGTGYAWLLYLISGFAGNMLNAHFYGSAHNSIGASTAVFGTVGVLAGLQFFEKFREKKTYAWIPFGAALGLLAMLGSSENTDFMAHLFGFLSGIPLGIITGRIYSKKDLPGRLAQTLFMVVFWAVFILSWMRAL
ncbi:MAG TPA: rhomboid family intramembrane serine protease [bacterium]|nr:rhomboid family intramembrane serine protease [bacterium]HQM85503.1 rhomboid family intramembrane serine protease [bacterium]